MKRFIDLLIVIISLLVLILPMLLISILVFFSSKGPVLYYSKRIGKDSKTFLMPKFRTMKIDTPDVATHLLETPEAHLTFIGSFLRKTSLDELPQLFSVFFGSMSIVGPRPALWNQYDLIELRKENQVDSLLPGITGHAQVEGRDKISIKEKVELDEFYLKNKSLYLDIKIILKTFLKVFKMSDVEF